MRVAFVMDQQVGLRTHALTLKKFVQASSTIEATFIDVRYDAGALRKLPGSGTLAGVREIRRGVGDPTRFDAIVWASWVTKFVPDLVEAVPSYLIMDMTPTQMTQMGDLYGYTTRRAEFLGAYKRRSTERIYRAAKHFFPWNGWVGQSLIDDWGVPESKITPLSPGVDTGVFAPFTSPPSPLPQALASSLREGEPERLTDSKTPPLSAKRPGEGGYPLAGGGRGNSVRLLFVGGDFLRKGGDLLLQWVRETSHPVELHLVTRDDVPNAPQNVTIHRGIAPLSPELVGLYQSSNVFVLPTRADCYSLVALEAMACGLPVVISALGGIPEIVAEGDTGYLIAPDDYPTLAARLDSLVTDRALRARMGMAGRTRACQHFDANCLVEKLIQRIANIASLPERAESKMRAA